MSSSPKILVAMSGGVDSSLAAALLKEQGYEIAGAFMKTWMHEDESTVFADCPWEQDMEDARKVAQQLGIDFEVVNLIDDYRKRVVDYLVEGYRNGTTPNPDIMCNREMKFGVFRDWAKAQGFDAVATGHYCRKRTNADGSCDVLEGRDKNKDQSYFLAYVNQPQMQDAHFPVGELLKPEVRAAAQRLALPTATKNDSQGICFLGKIKIGDFLEQFIEDQPGDIVKLDGTPLGQHRGLHRFTLGQRKGIGIPSNTDNKNYVVVGKDVEKNHLIVAFDEPDTPGLYQTHMRLRSLSWINKPPTLPANILAKPRYRDPSTPVAITAGDDAPDTLRLTFAEPQRALALGQVCAIYDGETLLGGGVYY